MFIRVKGNEVLVPAAALLLRNRQEDVLLAARDALDVGKVDLVERDELILALRASLVPPEVVEGGAHEAGGARTAARRKKIKSGTNQRTTRG